MHRNALTILFGVLVALVAAPAAAADAPVVETVNKTVPIREGTTTETKVRCPRTMAAIAGTVVSHPSGSTLRKSLPSGIRTWRFGFGGYVGAAKHRARVRLRCIGLDVPAQAGKVNLNVNTVSRRIGVEALGTATASASCRKGYVPTAWGFDIRPPNTQQNVLPAEETQVFRALASSTAYFFGLENLGAGGHSGLMRVRCLQRKAGSGGLTHSWRIKRQRYSNRIRGGVRTVRHSCPRGYLSLGAGHQIDPAGDVAFRRSYDVRAGSARWRFENAGGTDRVTTQLLCLNTGTNFR